MITIGQMAVTLIVIIIIAGISELHGYKKGRKDTLESIKYRLKGVLSDEEMENL